MNIPSEQPAALLGTHRALVAAAVVICALALALPARADDWLATLEPCAIPDASRPELALLYPRAGLPVVASAGDTFTVRVRVPAALTPPPGVQQEKVLRAWTADVLGQGLPLGGAGATLSFEHRYSLSATNLRPDGAASLVYRVTFALPAFVAPGTYDLLVRTPFGLLHGEASLAVVARGAAPRLRTLAGDAAPELPRALAALPVDIWVVPPSAAGALVPSTPPRTGVPMLHAQPWLASDVRGVTLRLGQSTLLQRACRSAAELDAGVAPPLAPLTAAELQLTLAPSVLEVDNRSASPVELPLSIEASASTRVTGGTLELFPATDVHLRRLSVLAGVLRVPAGSRSRVELAVAREAPDYALEPHSAIAGRPFTLRVLGARSDARVAYDLGSLQSALDGPRLTTKLVAPGGHHLTALVIAPDGRAKAARGELWVEPEKPATTCALVHASAGRGKRASPSAWAVPLFAGLVLLKRRARRPRGNRLAP
ncbi:MAG TPA: hypothetical protein VHM19_22000 [Polyangiales bacterium]|nr:hypothetical protein [Polyangiales bacterium]